ncbi:acetyltransferase [Pseudomonas sp. dw_358]|uniref:acetyltransferase n=1 Tax=Pseudomonas sp. dw_358 TaxID=2720083 RepID=UPI001BD1D167|nr:acetyltransferase [Pseudomonas sp. dw_358]
MADSHRKSLVIVGAGGLGRIVYSVLTADTVAMAEYKIIGFLDTRLDLQLPADIEVPILGNPLDYVPGADEYFIPAVGLPDWREKLVAPLLERGARFISQTRHSSMGARTTVGRGSFITPGAVVSVDCQIGEFAYLDTYVILGHDVVLGDHCQIGAMSFLAGGVRVGRGVSIHPRATIAKNVVIGDGAIVGIGSVVVNNVPPGVTVFGNPARVIHSSAPRDAAHG